MVWGILGIDYVHYSGLQLVVWNARRVARILCFPHIYSMTASDAFNLTFSVLYKVIQTFD